MTDTGRRLKGVSELKVFAHPLRLRLFSALTTEQEATASRSPRAVAVSAKRPVDAHQVSRLERFMHEEPAWGTSWSDAAFSTDSLLQLTPSELTEDGGRPAGGPHPLARPAGATLSRPHVEAC